MHPGLSFGEDYSALGMIDGLLLLIILIQLKISGKDFATNIICQSISLSASCNWRNSVVEPAD